MNKIVERIKKEFTNTPDLKVKEIKLNLFKTIYVVFIETICDGKNKLFRQYYSPQDIPMMVLKEKFGIDKAREFCNIHGLWENNI